MKQAEKRASKDQLQLPPIVESIQNVKYLKLYKGYELEVKWKTKNSIQPYLTSCFIHEQALLSTLLCPKKETFKESTQKELPITEHASEPCVTNTEQERQNRDKKQYKLETSQKEQRVKQNECETQAPKQNVPNEVQTRQAQNGDIKQSAQKQVAQQHNKLKAQKHPLDIQLISYIIENSLHDFSQIYKKISIPNKKCIDAEESPFIKPDQFKELFQQMQTRTKREEQEQESENVIQIQELKELNIDVLRKTTKYQTLLAAQIRQLSAKPTVKKAGQRKKRKTNFT